MLFLRVVFVVLLLHGVLNSRADEEADSLQSDLAPGRGLLLIPGLGRLDRLGIVLQNLKTLKSHLATEGRGGQWDCLVYVYAKEDDEFWGAEKRIKALKRMCNVVEHPGRLITENLLLVNPDHLDMYTHVFILLDDVALFSDPKLGEKGQSNFDLNHMMDVMHHNKLTVASPRISSASTGGGMDWRKIMSLPPRHDTEGFVSNFVEIFAFLMTMPAYEALYELFHTETNPYCWGYDMWYSLYCSSYRPAPPGPVKGHKIGIVSTQVARHLQGESGRTDKAKTTTKWQGVLDQEKHYKKHKGVDLAKIRSNFGTLCLKNQTETGASSGVLEKLPVQWADDEYAKKKRTSYMVVDMPLDKSKVSSDFDVTPFLPPKYQQAAKEEDKLLSIGGIKDEDNLSSFVDEIHPHQKSDKDKGRRGKKKRGKNNRQGEGEGGKETDDYVSSKTDT